MANAFISTALFDRIFKVAKSIVNPKHNAKLSMAQLPKDLELVFEPPFLVIAGKQPLDNM
jgi:hypothetical protein